MFKVKYHSSLLKKRRFVDHLFESFAFRFLKDLDVSCNEIENIEPLAALHDLETLDVSDNRIEETLQVENLVKCSQLVELQIAKNPILERKTDADISLMLPNLKFLNNVKFKNCF